MPGGRIPVCIQQQRWSAWNVPPMWAAASDEIDIHPLLEWVARATTGSAEITSASGEQCSISAALQEGFHALRAELRSRGITSKERLVTWAHGQGFSPVRCDQHIHWQCQEFILNASVEADIAVANIELSYTGLALHFSQEPNLQAALERHLSPRRPGARQSQSVANSSGMVVGGQHSPSDPLRGPNRSESNMEPNSSGSRRTPGQPTTDAWRFIAELNLEDTLRQQVRTVREPPRWFRGSLRQAFAMALQVREQRPAAGWKLFVLVPRMSLRPTSEFGQVGKKQFVERMRRLQQGDWEALLLEAATVEGEGRQQSCEFDVEAAEETRRKDAARKIHFARSLAHARC